MMEVLLFLMAFLLPLVSNLNKPFFDIAVFMLFVCMNVYEWLWGYENGEVNEEIGML